MAWTLLGNQVRAHRSPIDLFLIGDLMASNTAFAESPTEYVSSFDAAWQRIVDEAPVSKLSAFGRAAGEATRRGLRASADLAALLHTGDKTRVVHCVATELSTSGAVVNTRHHVDPHAIVDLWIALPTTILKVKARSVRNLDSAQAFEFVEVDDVERLNLAEYLDHTGHVLS
jgi:hypothetical protein